MCHPLGIFGNIFYSYNFFRDMKHVWILNHYAQEPGGVGGTRHFHFAQYLPCFDWECTIIAASVEHQTGEQRLKGGEATRLDYFCGVPFLWVDTPEYKGNNGGRLRNMLAYSWRVILKKTTVSLPRPDVVIGSSVHPFAAVAGAFLARRFRVPFVFEVRDLWPQTLVDMGRLREGSAVTWFFRKLERWLYRRAARIVVLLPRAWEYIVPLGIDRESVVWIPNGVNLSMFRDSELCMHAADDSFTLMYFGAHGQANDLDNILYAMHFVQETLVKQNICKRIHLRLVGGGPLKSELIDLSKRLGLTDVSFEPPVAKSEIPALAAQADAFVISVLDLPGLYRYGISMNKLFDYLAAARPIVIASDATNNPVEEANAGISVRAGEPEELAKAILQMASAPFEERQRMGRAGRKYVEENYDFEQLTGRLATVLNEAVSD